MTDDNTLDIPRRKALGALGTIGLASAGAGLGTSAYFTDEETFEDNSIVAGTGELFVDWQQTITQSATRPVNAYPDPNDDGRQSLGDLTFAGFDTARSPSSPGPLPQTNDIPDVRGDCADGELGLRQRPEEYCISPIEGAASVESFYDYQSGTRSSGNTAIQRADTTRICFYRETATGDLYLVIINDRQGDDDGATATVQIDGLDASTASGDPWVVKDDPDDDYTANSATWEWRAGETDGGVAGPLVPASGEPGFCLHVPTSLETDSLQVLDGDPDTAIDLDPTRDFVVCSETGLESGDQLPVPEVYQSEQAPNQQHLIEVRDAKPGDSGQTTFSLHVADLDVYAWLFADNYETAENGITEPEADAANEDQFVNETGGIERKDPDPNAPGATVELPYAIQVRIWYDENCDETYQESETIIFEGSLADAMAILTQTNANGVPGVPLDGDRSTAYDAIVSGTVDDGIDPDRECFEALTTTCIGFEWALPVEVGNAVQSDSVAFDIGFYTEQCSLNDGSGLGPEES